MLEKLGMSFLNRISLHPRFGAGLEMALGLALFAALYRLASPVFLIFWFIGRTAFSAALSLGLVYYPATPKRWFHAIILGAFHTGLLPFFLFTDWPPAWYFLGIISVFLPAASFYAIPSAQQGLSFEIKPFRRLCLSMTTIAVAGLWSGFLALLEFQLASWMDWWWGILAVFLSAGLMALWWHAYETPFTRRTLQGLLLLGLLMAELGFIVTISPAGYLVGGLILTWCWYLLFLMGRFYLSAPGLNVKKQLPYVVINAILMLIYLLFFVRWK